MKKRIRQILKEETKDQYILEIPSLRFIPNADLKTPEGKTNAWNELLRLLNGKPFIFDDNLNFSKCNITSLGNLQSVGGSLSLYDCENLNSLGNLQSVNGYLNMTFTKITSLGNLKSVGGNLSLTNSKITSLGNLQSVGGFLYLEGTKITSLGNLQSVGGSMDLKNCKKLISLGNLQSVGGNLDLQDCTNLTSFGNLKYIGNWLNLSITKTSPLGFMKTPLSKKYSEEEIRQMVNIKGDIIYDENEIKRRSRG